jgi:hypothetical protein
VVRAYVRASKEAQAEQKVFDLKPIEADRFAKLKELATALTRVEANAKHVLKFLSDKDKTVKQMALLWQAWANASLDIITETVDALVRQVPFDNSERLLKNGVPIWVFKFLKSRDLASITDLRRACFPSDPTKGLRLTVKEFLDPVMNNLCKYVLSNSGFIARILRDSPELREIFKSKGPIEFHVRNSLPPSAKAFYDKGELLIPSPFFGLGYSLLPTIMGKTPKFPRRWDFSKPEFVIPNLIECLLKVSSYSAPYNDMYVAFWDPLLKDTGFSLREKVTPLKNLPSVALDNADKVAERFKLYATASSVSARRLLYENMSSDLRLMRTSTEVLLLERVLMIRPGITPSWSFDYRGFSTDINLDEKVQSYPKAEVFSTYSAPITEEELGYKEHVLGTLRFERKTTVRDREKRMHMNPAFLDLSPRAERVIAKLAAERTTAALAEPIGHWLQEFLHRKMQNAAVQFVRAHFQPGRDITDQNNSDSELDENPDLHEDNDDY